MKVTLKIEIEKCSTCNGTDKVRPKDCVCPMFADTKGFRIADLTCPVHGVSGSEPGDGQWTVCPDCVSGRVTQQGTIKWRCSAHNSLRSVRGDVCHVRWGIDNHFLNTPESHDETTPQVLLCVFGLVLVVPLEETT